MKNIELIAFFFWSGLFGLGPAFVGAQSKNYTVSLRSDYDFSKKEFIESAKINLPYIEGRACVNNDLKWNYALSFSSLKLFPDFQFKIKAGHLSGGGSLSKLNSPALSSSLSPFCPASLKASNLEVSPGQYDSFSSPQSFFIGSDIKVNDIIRQISLGFFYKAQEDYKNNPITANVAIKVLPAKKIDLSFSSTGGIYPYEKTKVTSWYLNQSFYGSGRHFCFNNQISFNSPIFSGLFIANTYQTPFGSFVTTWHSENLIKVQDFSFNLNAFYNPNEMVITSSDKKLKPLLQTSLGGQYDFMAGKKRPVKISSGIKSLLDFNLTENEHSLKNAFGIRYTSGDYNGLFEINSTFKLTNLDEGINASFSGASIRNSTTFYIKDFTGSLSENFSFTPDAKKTKWTFSQTISLGIEYKSPGGMLDISSKNHITFTQKTGQKNKIDFGASISLKLTFGF